MAVTLTTTGITFSDGTSTDTNLVPAGTKMLFGQTTAPTGWTKQVTHDNKMLRVVSGIKADGGSSNFTSVFNTRGISGSITATTLGINEMPAHSHDLGGGGGNWQGLGFDDYNFSFPGAKDAEPPLARDFGEAYIGSYGSSGSHDHGFTGTSIDFNVKYVDTIIAAKD